MIPRSKNFLILISVLLFAGAAALVAAFYIDEAPDVEQECNQEIKICSDGSSVFRTGPNCEFSACSADKPDEDDLINPSEPAPVPPTSPAGPVACTMDVMGCPDGTFVGRIAPDCEFAACPTHTAPDDDFMACADVYEPVCARVQVQCVTTPCDPVLETFGNACNADQNDNVISYTEGACEEQ